jgi:hypothetical protein
MGLRQPSGHVRGGGLGVYVFDVVSGYLNTQNLV